MLKVFLQGCQKSVFRAHVSMIFSSHARRETVFGNGSSRIFLKPFSSFYFSSQHSSGVFLSPRKNFGSIASLFRLFWERFRSIVILEKLCFFAICIHHQNKENQPNERESNSTPIRNLKKRLETITKLWYMHSAWKYRQYCRARFSHVAHVSPKWRTSRGKIKKLRFGKFQIISHVEHGLKYATVAFVFRHFLVVLR